MSSGLEADVRAIMQLYAQGRFEQGLARARALYRAAPQSGVGNYCMGHGLAAMQRPREALPYLRKAAQIEPRNAEFLTRFGRALLDAGRVREAESVLAKAHDLNPALPVVPWTLGIHYASIDRFDKAVSHFDRALHAQLPANMAAAVRLDWANALIEVGRAGEAETVLRELLPDQGARPAALAKLSLIAPARAGSPDLALIEAELSRPGLSGDARALLLTAKAAALASAGDYAAEYEALQAAKSVRAAAFDVAGFGHFVDKVIATFTADVIRHLAALFGSSTFRPIHVVGLPRSGTTLTEKILSAHSGVGGAGELSLVNDFFRTVLEGKDVAAFPAAADAAGAAKLREMVGDMEATMRHLCPGAERIVDKMPHNFLRCGLIAAAFPQGRIIHCFRNPADNYISGFRASLGTAHAYFDDPQAFIGYHRHYQRLMQHWHDVLPGRIYPLHYEKLVSAPRDVIADMLAFCGLAWEDACLHPESGKARIGTASVMQARSPINTSSLGNWKRYASYVQPVADALGDGGVA